MRNSIDEAAGNAIKYTIKKFLRFLPFVVFPAFVTFVLWVYFDELTVASVQRLILDTLFLGPSIWGSYAINVPLWYLGTMFAVFPLFSFLCQTKSKNVLYIFSSLFVIIVYGQTSELSNGIAPHSLLRAFAGLMLGVISYGVSDYLSTHDFSRKMRMALTLIEVCCFTGVFAGCYLNIDAVYLYMVCFVVGIAISLSDVTYTKHIHIKCLDQIGDFSLAIYTWHWVVGADFAWRISNTFHYYNMEVLYYGGALVCAIMNCVLVKVSRYFFFIWKEKSAIGQSKGII